MITSNSSHSAYVTLELLFDEQSIALAQVAHNIAIPIEEVSLPAGTGEIMMQVDGKTIRMPVFLPEGARRDRLRIPLSSVL